VKAYGLSDMFLQDRRIFDKSLKTVSIDSKERIMSIGNWSKSEDLINPYILVVDSSLIKAYKGKVGHKSSMRKGIVPCFGIDADARCGYSHTRGWIFGYKLHIVSSTDSVVGLLSADITTANMLENYAIQI
jgi:hypothetical protein